MQAYLRPLLLLALAGVLLASCGAPTAATTQAGASATIAGASRLLAAPGDGGMPEIGEQAPDFSYTLDGATHKLSDLHGKRVLLNFWATWCAPCAVEMPDLQRASRQYGDDVVILGVNRLEDTDKIAAYAAEKQIGFTLIANTSGDISDRYAAKNIPMSFFINRDGTIGYRQLGVMNYDLIRRQLDALK